MAQCSIHSDVAASGACDRCGRFMCKPCGYPLPGPFGRTCLLCVEDRIFPEAKETLRRMRLHVTIILAIASLFILPLGGVGIGSWFFKGDDVAAAIPFIVIAIVIVVVGLAGWRQKESLGRGYFVSGFLFLGSLGFLADPTFRIAAVAGAIVTGYCAFRVFSLRRFRTAFVEMRRLRELRIGQAVLQSAQVPRNPDEPRVIRR